MRSRKRGRKGHRKNNWCRTCEICGNESIHREKIFKCSYCGMVNGLGVDKNERETRLLDKKLTEK